MWGFLTAVWLTVAVLFWSSKYLKPYVPEHEVEAQVQDIKEIEDMPSFDDIIAAIYNRED